MLGRLARGTLSSLSTLAHPLGRWSQGDRHLDTAERRAQGLAIILPGIEGRSYLNLGIAAGLADAGFPGAIEIFDWTTGVILLFPYHLRSPGRNKRRAVHLAERITAYQRAYPGRPLHLIGHSGGGGLALMALETLAERSQIESAVLLVPAVSPAYNLAGALARVARGITHFWSPLDLFFLGAGTLVLGTMDGRHTVSAGARGFRMPAGLSPADEALYATKLRQIEFRLGMAQAFNFGGHMGCTNRVFAAEWLAPLLVDTPSAGPIIASR